MSAAGHVSFSSLTFSSQLISQSLLPFRQHIGTPILAPTPFPRRITDPSSNPMKRARSTSRSRSRVPAAHSLKGSSRSPEPMRAQENGVHPSGWMRSNGLWNLPNVLSMARVVLIPVSISHILGPYVLPLKHLRTGARSAAISSVESQRRSILPNFCAGLTYRLCRRVRIRIACFRPHRHTLSCMGRYLSSGVNSYEFRWRSCSASSGPLERFRASVRRVKRKMVHSKL